MRVSRADGRKRCGRRCRSLSAWDVVHTWVVLPKVLDEGAKLVFFLDILSTY